MSLFGSLHLLAPEIPDGLSIWRLQICGEGSSTYETLLLSNGELAHMRARAAKRPAATLPPPEPTVSAAAHRAEQLRAEALTYTILKMRADLDQADARLLQAGNTAQSEMETLRNDASAVDAQLVLTQAELASGRNDLTILMAESDVARASAHTAMAAMEALQSDLALAKGLVASQAERLEAWPVPLSPWAEVGRALRRALGL